MNTAVHRWRPISAGESVKRLGGPFEATKS